MVKTNIVTIAIAALTLFGAATQAEARAHHSSRIYTSGYRARGTPVYTERYFIGSDHCGKPILGTRVIRRHFRPVVRPHCALPCRAPAR